MGTRPRTRLGDNYESLGNKENTETLRPRSAFSEACTATLCRPLRIFQFLTILLLFALVIFMTAKSATAKPIHISHPASILLIILTASYLFFIAIDMISQFGGHGLPDSPMFLFSFLGVVLFAIAGGLMVHYRNPEDHLWALLLSQILCFILLETEVPFLEAMLPLHSSWNLRPEGDEDNLHTRRSPRRRHRVGKMRSRDECQSLRNSTGNERGFGCRGTRLQKDRHRSQKAVRRLPFKCSSSSDRSDRSDPDRDRPDKYHRVSDRKNRDDRIHSSNDQPMRAVQSADGSCTANSLRFIAIPLVYIPESIPLADSNSIATTSSSPIASRNYAVQCASISLPQPSSSAWKLRSMSGFLSHGARRNPHRRQSLLPIVQLRCEDSRTVSSSRAVSSGPIVPAPSIRLAAAAGIDRYDDETPDRKRQRLRDSRYNREIRDRTWGLEYNEANAKSITTTYLTLRVLQI